MPHRVMIYGAERRRGERLARALAAVGPPPLLGGPDGAALAGLAHALQAGVRIFSHSDPRFAAAGLSGVEVVVNAAGRWTSTTPALVEACLRTRTHYVDFCDAWDVLAGVSQLEDLARAERVCLVPGLTFDSVAGDGLAARLSNVAPGSNHLEFASHVPDGLPDGLVDMIARRPRRAGLIRSAGAWKSQRVGSPRREVDFGLGPQRCMALPLASLAMLGHGPRAPNLICYAAVTSAEELVLRACRRGWFLGRTALHALLAPHREADVANDPPGSAFCELRDDTGCRRHALLHTPHTEAFVEAAALDAVRGLLDGRARPGRSSPSAVCGDDFLLRLPDVVCRDEGEGRARATVRARSPHLAAERA